VRQCVLEDGDERPAETLTGLTVISTKCYVGPLRKSGRDLSGLDRAQLIARLDEALPTLWYKDYLTMPGSTNGLVTVTIGDESRESAFCRYLFDHASSVSSSSEADRVASVWGTSRKTNARTRDRARMKGFPIGKLSSTPDDRGHFFAHTMGGRLDINVFPQSARVNRGGLWRQMENYCARNPGTFCFIRPIYEDATWRPAKLEYGVIKVEGGKRLAFWGHVFEN
jgi:DNA/RNA non-specific endonuclease